MKSSAKDKWKSESYILKVVLNICLAASVSSYFVVYFNTIPFRYTITIFNITYDPAFMQGLLSFCIHMGAALGGYYSRWFIDRYSRK